MKLKFGKKTLALLLMLTVALSLCTVSAWAGEATEVEIGNSSLLTAPSEANESEVNWSIKEGSSNVEIIDTDSGKAVKGTSLGTATVTASWTVNGEGGTTENKSVDFTFRITEGTISSISASPANIEVPFGTSESDALAKLASQVNVTATNSHNGNFLVNANWSFAEGAWTGNVSEQGVTATATYGTGTGAKTTTVTVKVIKATLSATSPSKVTVPVGTVGTKVARPTTISAKNGTTSVTLTEGTDFDWNTSSAYSETAAGTYTYTAMLKGAAAQNYTLNNYSYVIESKSTWSLTAYTFKTVIEGDDDYFDLGTTLNSEFYAQIKALTGITSPSVSITYSDLDLGTVSSGGRFTVDLTSSEEDTLATKGYLTDEITCTAVVSGTTYTCKVNLTLYSENVSIDFGKEAGTLAKVASALNDRLNALYSSGLAYIDIEDIELDGGELYTDSTCAETVEEGDDYAAAAFSQMYYVPTGSGETTEIEFTARTGSNSSSDKLSGYLYLTSDKYVRLAYTITTEDTLAFTADEFESAFLDLDDDYETLEYITFTSGIPNSKTAGYLYYDGDTKVSTSKKYYVESSKSSELLIDDLSFVPGTKGGVYSIQFTMYGKNDRNKTVKETGVLQITVTEKADVTISAAKNASVDLSFDDFQDYFDANVSKSKKDYVITHIVFEDAPNSKTAGYLYAGSKKLTSPNGKEFALDEDYKGDYDFDDLSYMGGSKDTSTRATFTIYGKKNANAKTTTKLLEGTVDFVTGDVGSTSKDLTATLPASQIMPFSDEISQFLKIQSDMDYMVFTDLPRTGKLVYNWGASGQTDVTVNTPYYLSGSNKLLLKNVTFVPGYTSNKSSNTVTFGYKAVSSKGKTVTGNFTLTVTHAYVSTQFNDVTNYLYADSVDFLYNEKITTGNSATTFNPNGQVTRMEFVTFLYRAAGSPSVSGLTNKFKDVSATTHSYYYNAILWASANGITDGTGNGNFNPTGKVTHVELLTFLYKYDVNYLHHTSGSASLGSYSGWSSVADWAQTGAKWAAYKGILTDSTTPPASNGTRATVALWLHRMLTL